MKKLLLKSFILCGFLGYTQNKKYDYTSDFSEGLAFGGLNNKYCYIDKQGNIVNPIKYDFANAFFNGQAEVEKNVKNFYNNKKGEFVKDCP